MKIESIDKQSFVTLRLEERGDDRLPGCRFAIEAQVGDFTGRYEQVWVEQLALERFSREMKELESTRRGSAGLEAMSPGEFVLQIKAIDSAGHVAVTVLLQRRGYVGREPQRFGVEGGFELDPSTLPELVRACSKLAT